MSEGNPWKRVGSRLVYENPWMTLREDQVISPTGKPGIYSVVDTRVATGVVAMTDDQEIYRYYSPGISSMSEDRFAAQHVSQSCESV